MHQGLWFVMACMVGCGGAAGTQTTPTATPATPSAAAEEPPPVEGPPEYSITNLYDAFGHEREGLTYDFGFSALVRYGDLTILFDAGSHNDIFVANARALGIDLRTIDIVVLSHNHPDHIGGMHAVLDANPDAKVYLPADPFLGGWLPFNYMGNAEAIEALPEEERYHAHGSGRVGIEGSGPFPNADVQFVDEHTEIAPGVRLVPTRAELMGYFMAYPPHEEEPVRVPLAEITLALDTADGQVLVVGCSHSTVETIVRAAREHVDRPVELLMGGYHLLPYSEDAIRGVVAVLAGELGVQQVAPSHCTGPLATRILRESFTDRYVLGGLGEHISYGPPPDH